MRVAVLASGQGTIFQSIVDYVRAGILRGIEVSLLISNRPSSGALERALKAGINALLITSKRHDGTKKSIEEFEEEIIRALRSYDIDLVFLAGWDKVLNKVVDAYPYRIMNTHPSLLPSFAGLYGMEVHRAVLARGCKVTGCTIHFVDKGVDTGPIILQRAVQVSEDETAESLAEKVKRVERELAPMALQLYRDGRISLIERDGNVVTRVDYSGGWLEDWEGRVRESRYKIMEG